MTRALELVAVQAGALPRLSGARMKVRAERDSTSAVPTLPPAPSKAGLVDEYHLIIAPWVVGGGRQSLPPGVPAARAVG